MNMESTILVKNLRIFAFLLAVGISTFIILSPQKAFAEDAEWVDYAYIKYGDRMFYDKNPYDQLPDFAATDADGCGDDIIKFSINVGKFNGDLDPANQATFVNKRKNDFGCQEESKSISVSDANQEKGIYKLSNDVYLVPAGYTCSGLPPLGIDTSTDAAAYYKKPNDTSGLPDIKKNAFFRVGDDGKLIQEDFLRDDGNGSGNLAITGCGLNESRQLQITNSRPLWQLPPTPPGVTIPNTPGQTPPPTSGGGDTSSNPQTCEQNNPGGFSWLFCGTLDVVDNAVGEIIDQAYALLNLNPQLYDTNQEGGKKLQQVWAYFRNISSLLLIIIGLVMIIGQAISRE